MTKINQLELKKTQLNQWIRKQAEKMGFDLVGIVPADPPKLIDRYREWLNLGYAGEMEYLHRHFPLKQDPKNLLPEVKSVISLGLNYYTVEPDAVRKLDPTRGQISRYAWGEDYHDVIRKRLKRLVKKIEKRLKRETKSRVFVDSGPILERDYAQTAGLGWIGKNTNLINWQKGSWYFLAEILISLDLGVDVLPARGSCGSCTLCIEACPTDAIVAPNQVDARSCISYLTVELKEAIPMDLRPGLGNLIFGCDICQEVCPWNTKSQPTSVKEFQPRKGNLLPKLADLIGITQNEFSQKFKGSPIKRTKRRGLLRNVVVAMGNSKDPSMVEPLQSAILDVEPLVRQHAAWALGQIATPLAETILKKKLQNEENIEVIIEIESALQIIESENIKD